MRSLQSVESFFIVALVITLPCVQPSIAHSQDDLTFEPYSVFVAEEESYAYCGPAEEYYRTDPLRYGQSLEVYAETEDGWLGIRPPQDSFCWVPADTVELDPSEEQGTVIEDRTVAWIGTHLGRARKYRWQVQLAKGEPVTVIGRSEREGPDGPQLWYRIVPPSGEYRWIHRNSVVMSSEELVESVRRQETPPTGQPMADRATSSPASFAPSETLSPSASPVEDSNDEPAVASSGTSILNRDRAIGSGLNDAWRTNPSTSDNRRSPSVIQTSAFEEPSSAVDAFKQGGLLASLEFLTRPRIQDIGGQPETAPQHESAPGANQLGANQSQTDSAWVAGATRSQDIQRGVASAGLGTPITTPTSLTNDPNQIRQVSGQSIGTPQGMGQSVSPAMHSFHIVSAERISQIEAEVNGADLDRLNLILSRLMAAQASTAEAEPVERAAKQFASTSTDAVAAGRARMLAETAERYRHIANYRDGQSVIQTSAAIPTGPASTDSLSRGTLGATPVAVVIPPSAVPQSAPAQPALPQPAFPAAGSPSTAMPQGGIDHGSGVMEQNGYLVQVYSARSNSPPFALTDHAGRTVAYVTPAPGVNLRTHLNSQISVVGSRGYLTGLNTPHIMVTQAVRTPE